MAETAISPLSDIDKQIAELTQQRIRAMTPASPMPMPSTPGLPAASAAAGTPTAAQPAPQPAPYDLNARRQPMPVPELPPVEPKPQFDVQSGSAQRNVRPNFGGGATGAVGSVAYLGDAVLRGYMQGKQMQEAKHADEVNRLQKGLRYNYEVSARNYLGMIESGADPSSPEVQQARDARDAAWNTLMQMQSHYIMGDEGGKKKPKKKAGSTPAATGAAAAASPDADPASAQNIAAMLQSADPQEKAKGVFLMSQKVGPPDEYQAKQIIARRQAYLQDPETRINQIKGQILRTRMDPKATPEEKQRADELQKQLEGYMQAVSGRAAPAPHWMTGASTIPGESLAGKKNPDGSDMLDALGNPFDPKKQYRQKDLGNGQLEYYPVQSKGLTSAPKLEVKGNVPVITYEGKMYTASNIKEAPEEIQGAFNDVEKGIRTGKFSQRSGEFTFVDAANRLWRIPYTTTTVSSMGGGHSSVPPAPAAGTHAAPPASAPATQKTSSAAAAGTAPAPPASIPGLQSPIKGARYIGEKLPQGQTKSRADAADTLLNLMPSMHQLVDDPSVQANMGVFNGRWSEIENKVGNLDQKTKQLWAELKSLYAFNATLHGFRSLHTIEEFQNAFGDLHTDPESLKGGLAGAEEAAKAAFRTGYNIDWAPDWKSNFPAPGQPTGTGAGAGAAPPKTLKWDQIVQAAHEHGITPEQAAADATKQGIKIEGGPRLPTAPKAASGKPETKSEPKSGSKPEPRVKVRDKKSGQTGTLPQSQVDAAIASGQYERVQ